MTHTVPHVDTTRKPRKAWYAHYYDQHGVLTADEGGQVWFLDSDTDELIAIDPTMYRWIDVHGECGLADAQLAADRRHGGYVAVACSRLQEVA